MTFLFLEGQLLSKVVLNGQKQLITQKHKKIQQQQQVA